MTGQGYYYGFTFKDSNTVTTSHHLLSTFEFASKAELDEYYAKIVKAVGGCSGVSAPELVTRDSEVVIVGPQPENPSEPTDTVESASPYIYNTSIRSTLGMCGVFLDGAGTDGFRSCVLAQYTGVSLQKDLKCFQKNNGTDWVGVSSYSEYINTSPNDLRHNPKLRSFHIRAVNNAVCQEVSVFAIGQAIHHQVESGGEITITNSNSNWGGCAALAIGFHDKAAPTDKFHQIRFIERPLLPTENATVQEIKIGELVDDQDRNSKILKFKKPVDKNFERKGYSLEGNPYIWVVNPLGADYRARVADEPYPDGTDDEIRIDELLRTDNADGNNRPSDPDPNSGTTDQQRLNYAELGGQQVYIRRLLDTRRTDDRTYTILLDGDRNTRPPVRDYVPQIDGSNWQERVSTVLATTAEPDIDNVTSRVQLRQSKRPNSENKFDSNKYYRPADTIINDDDNKHYTCIQRTYGDFDSNDWDESYVHMESEYCSEGYYKNAAPVVLIDGDDDESEISEDLGITYDGIVKAQIVSATDYDGLYQLLRNLGKSEADAKAMLEPVATEDDKLLDVRNEGWELEFRRPSNIRLFSHAFEWAGYSNYTKAVPKYQKFMSQTNKFTYYYTHQSGGRVYVSGFNEEGFLITNRGIQDLATGDTVPLDVIGAPDISLEPETIDCGQPGTVGGFQRATKDEVEVAVACGTVEEAECKAVTVDTLCELTSAIGDQIQQDIKVLPDEYSQVFVHADVERELGDDMAEDGLPQIVIDAYKQKVGSRKKQVLNEKKGDEFGARKLAFRTIWQAFRWVNNRAPVGDPNLTCWVIGEQNPDEDPLADSVVNINATKGTKIRGYLDYDTNNDTNEYERNKIYLKKSIRVGNNCAQFQIMDVTVSVGGTINDPESPYRDEANTLRCDNEFVEITNVALINRSNTQSTCPFTQYDASTTAICRVPFRRDTPTVFIMDGKSNLDTNTNNYGIISAAFKNLDIISGASGTNTRQNLMKWSFSHQNTKALRFLAQAMSVTVRRVNGDANRQNGNFKWEFDFNGHRGTDIIGLMPQARSRFVVENAAEFEAEVLDLGSLDKINLFGNRGANEPGQFYPITDTYKVKREDARPENDDGTFNNINTYLNNTVTGQIAKAFTAAGYSWGGNDYCFQVHPTMVYNGKYIESGPTQYPNNTSVTFDEADDYLDLDVINPEDSDDDLPNGKMLLE